jgi:hypothetical protein
LPLKTLVFNDAITPLKYRHKKSLSLLKPTFGMHKEAHIRIGHSSYSTKNKSLDITAHKIIKADGNASFNSSPQQQLLNPSYTRFEKKAKNKIYKLKNSIISPKNVSSYFKIDSIAPQKQNPRLFTYLENCNQIYYQSLHKYRKETINQAS